MAEKSIKLNFLFSIILNISKVIFPLITAPYVARVLEPEGVGLFNFANTYATYFALFAGLGIPTYGVREIAKIRDDKKCQTKFMSEILSLSFITTLITSAFFLVSILCIPQLNRNLVIFVVSGIVLYVTPLKIDWLYSGREEFGYIAIRSLAVKTSSVVCLFVFVHEKTDLLLYVSLNVVASILNDLWNFFKMLRSGIRPSLTFRFGQHVKPLLFLFSSAIAVSVYTILDTIMLGFMREYSEVAFYNGASHISKSLLAVSTSLCAVAMPRISFYQKQGKWDEINSLIKKSFSVVSFLAFPITFGIVAVAPVFIPLFYGQAFVGAVVPLQIMIFIVLFVGLNNLTGTQILIGLGLDKYLLYSVLFGAILNFSLNLLLIPYYGASGAAVASVFAETIIFFITLYFVRTKTLVSVCWIRDFFLSLCCAGIIFPIAKSFSMFLNGWFFIFAVVLCSGFGYILLQFLVKNESVLIVQNAIMKKVKRNDLR